MYHKSITKVIMIVILYITLGNVQYTGQFTSPVLTGYNLNTIYVKQQSQCITEMLWHEARNQPIEGIKAVLSVAMHRKNTKGFPDDYCTVIQQPYQYSYRNKYIKANRNARVKINVQPSEHKIHATIRELAFEAAVGSFKPVVEDNVLYYFRYDLKKYPGWSRKLVKHGRIGDHLFLKV